MIDLFNSLNGIFSRIPLDFCDKSGKFLLNSSEMRDICLMIPGWAEIIHKGLKHNELETFRTLRHVFRTLWVYFAILRDDYQVDVKSNNLKSLKDTLENINELHPDMFPLLLLFHDIGRPFNREWHTYESAKIIKENKLLKHFSISPTQEKILKVSIKFHLLPGTIFTGESSYCGALSLLLDEDLNDICLFSSKINLLFSILMAFSLIDIWGYDYGKIYDHYFSYYSQIKSNLSKIFIKNALKAPSERFAAFHEDLFKLDEQNLKWRISCASRIFQFIETQNYLTKDFFYDKIDEALASINLDWNEFKDSLGKVHAIIQFKYALPIMMILASGSFKREPLDPKERIQTRIFNFWKICGEIVKKVDKKSLKVKNNDIVLWNFIFEFSRGSIFKPSFFNYIFSDEFFNTLQGQIPRFDSELNNYLINIK
ncbi:MAG: hypothetical protein EU539_12945 [Promethearchaeota archaeon]|nr:MAG: hypothetical protein EU539_12945 [Candidatus Lokiarchaeota archaeon]